MEDDSERGGAEVQIVDEREGAGLDFPDTVLANDLVRIGTIGHVDGAVGEDVRRVQVRGHCPGMAVHVDIDAADQVLGGDIAAPRERVVDEVGPGAHAHGGEARAGR